MREEKIGILCLQETHLSDEHERQIESLFSRRLLVLNSQDPSRPGSSAGVAFVLNKEMINISNIKWLRFWDIVRTKWQQERLGTLDMMMGDFNITEDPLDRAPSKPDNEQAVEALRNFRSDLNLQDTWRHAHPTTRMFTFNSNTNTMSRLDRIYTSVSHNDSVSDWKAYLCPIPTDHNIIYVRFAPPGVPHIGKGRWTWPLSTLSDKTLLEKIEKLGITLQNEIESSNTADTRTNTKNPQTLWESFKNEITAEAQHMAKTHLAKINQKIKQLQRDITPKQNHPRKRTRAPRTQKI
ncbi:Endonuclease/exonuclease/phosphatase [Suillus ampliporus]|nr:Endonuclease/exonuclease/phosphatase [Suillus ampliporus]